MKRGRLVGAVAVSAELAALAGCSGPIDVDTGPDRATGTVTGTVAAVGGPVSDAGPHALANRTVTLVDDGQPHLPVALSLVLATAPTG